MDELEREKEGEDEGESRGGKLQNYCGSATDNEAESSEGAA